MLTTLLTGIDLQKIAGNVYYFILGLIILDVVTGLLAGAVERKLNSSISFKGLIKKVGELIALVFVTLIDAYFKSNGQITKIGIYLIIGYEGLSIIENFSKIGLNFKVLTKYFDPSKIGKGGNG